MSNLSVKIFSQNKFHVNWRVPSVLRSALTPARSSSESRSHVAACSLSPTSLQMKHYAIFSWILMSELRLSISTCKAKWEIKYLAKQPSSSVPRLFSFLIKRKFYLKYRNCVHNRKWVFQKGLEKGACFKAPSRVVWLMLLNSLWSLDFLKPVSVYKKELKWFLNSKWFMDLLACCCVTSSPTLCTSPPSWAPLLMSSAPRGGRGALRDSCFSLPVRVGGWDRAAHEGLRWES